MPLKRTPFVDDASCSCCLLRRSISSLRAAASRSFSSRSRRASYSSSVSFRSTTGSAFPDRERERSWSFRCLCLRFRLCRLSSPSMALPGERDRWRRLWRLCDLLSVSSSDSLLALTEVSFAGRKVHDELYEVAHHLSKRKKKRKLHVRGGAAFLRSSSSPQL